MTEILLLLAGLVSGLHVYTYGRWLRQQGNSPGAILAYALAAASAGLPAWRLLFK